jgi:hypothetical protein
MISADGRRSASDAWPGPSKTPSETAELMREIMKNI